MKMLDVKLIELIEQYNSSNKGLSEDMSLFHDLNIYGDDADELLEKYSEEFNVSLTNFKFSDYFPFEGDPIIPVIVSIIFKKKGKEFKRLTIRNLQEAIISKELK